MLCRPSLGKKAREEKVDGFINTDSTQISWTRSLKQELAKGRSHSYQAESLIPSLYRPFTKQWLYFNRTFNEMVYQMPKIFPKAGIENLVICVSGAGAKFGFCALITDTLPNLGMVDIGVTQCFPLYLYESNVAEVEDAEDRPDGLKPGQMTLLEDETGDLFEAAAAQPLAPKYTRKDGLTDEGLAHFQAAYPSEFITKEDVFYYVYGLLHSPDYRERYADNLSKELPRIPCVATAEDFWTFSQAGRKLADLHLNYETVEPYPVTVMGDTGSLSPAQYRVDKMKYGKKGKEKDLTTIHYNALITVSGIPLEAYEYVVNGRPAIDWVVERQCFKVDDGKNGSGLVSDANQWAAETVCKPRYALDLLMRVVRVGFETVRVVKKLPALNLATK